MSLTDERIEEIADKVFLTPNGVIQFARAIEQEALGKQEPVAWRPLFDSQWMNIVNHDHCYENYDKEDAVHMAVKLTEARLKMNNTSPQPCPKCADGMVVVTKEDANNYCQILTLLGMEEEGSPVEEVKRLISLHEGMTCGDCNDTGWLENREEGRYPCTCMTEAEPYQLLRAELEKKISAWNVWKLRTEDHDKTVEAQRQDLFDLRDKCAEFEQTCIDHGEIQQSLCKQIAELECELSGYKAITQSACKDANDYRDKIAELEAELETYRTNAQAGFNRQIADQNKIKELETQRDEAVSAVQRLSEGQPFDAVVIADAVKRATSQFEKKVVELEAALKDISLNGYAESVVLSVVGKEPELFNLNKKTQ